MVGWIVPVVPNLSGYGSLLLRVNPSLRAEGVPTLLLLRQGRVEARADAADLQDGRAKDTPGLSPSTRASRCSSGNKTHAEKGILQKTHTDKVRTPAS